MKERSLLLRCLIICLAFISCTPASEVTASVSANPQPEQYGTPFNDVPDARDAVIYQVNTRCFSSTRNFNGVIARLDSIKNLGVNVLYLMPIYPVGSLNGCNSPYCVKDYQAVNTEFGNLSDLRSLIAGAHERGMAVILDWVANHTSWDNAWIKNKSWYKQDASGNIVAPNSEWKDVAQLNFENADMRQAMIAAMKYWVYTANCDGFRCDYADGPSESFWHQAIDTLRNLSSHKLLLLAEGSGSRHFSEGFNYVFGFSFYGQLKSIYSNVNTSVKTLDQVNATEYAGASDENRVVRYITNHDVNSSDGTPLALFGGASGSMSAFVAAAYMKGVPMIYNGQEVGTPNQLLFPFTSSSIDWSLNKPMVAEYKKIINLWNSCTTLRRGTLTTYHSDDVCAFTKTSGSEMVLVLINMRSTTSNYALPSALANTNWTDAFSGLAADFGSSISMAPYSYRIVRNK